MLILNKETIIRQLIIIYSQCYELYKTEYADSELISNNFQQCINWKMKGGSLTNELYQDTSTYHVNFYSFKVLINLIDIHCFIW
jgi:hypothetical protein